MVCMYTNAEIPIKSYGDSLQLTNWILDSGMTCHTTPEISYFILDLLVETYKYIEFAYGHLVTEKQTGRVQVEMRDDNGKPLITTVYNLLLAPEL